jgi:hypothetical protein
VLNKSPQMRGARIGMGLPRQISCQYLDSGKKFNAADRPRIRFSG